jgi:hypothetical protein
MTADAQPPLACMLSGADPSSGTRRHPDCEWLLFAMIRLAMK